MGQALPAGLALLLGAVVPLHAQNEEWPISAPADQGLNAARLAQLDAHIRADLPHLRSLLIVRHSRLVFERYYGGSSRDELQNLQSMTKTVTSALAGIALKQKMISSVDTRILEYLPEYREAISDTRVREVTIRHLLTMTSGIAELGLSFDKAFTNPTAEILRRPLAAAPGQRFQYNSAAAHLLGAVLRKAIGRPVLEFARAQLFNPLGIGPVEWYADATGLQSGGLSGLFRARDMLKLGELYLRRGTWRGAELIPPAYVAESVKVHSEGEFYGERVRYGYLWWLASIAGHDGYYARGYGGQYLMVLPADDMVVLCTSDWKQPEYPRHFALIEEFILPAIVRK